MMIIIIAIIIIAIIIRYLYYSFQNILNRKLTLNYTLVGGNQNNYIELAYTLYNNKMNI